jgi:K+-sensing histidine kinase KdpD
MGVEINGEVIMGRSNGAPDIVTFFSEETADSLGVSRAHVMLRPTENKLYIIELGSTNGTFLNGHSIGVNMPHSLSDGDYLIIGRMEVMVRIIQRPAPAQRSHQAIKENIDDSLSMIARSIMSQVTQNQVMEKALDMILVYIAACEATIWLVDDQTGELLLKAGRGVENNKNLRLAINRALPGKVIETGEPLRVNRPVNGDPIKVATGYLVEAVIYVPLIIGGVAVGVLSAAHRQTGEIFTKAEEKLLQIIADLTATATQNARRFEATDEALKRRITVITALNYLLGYELKDMAKSSVGYAGMLESFNEFDDYNTELVQNINLTGSRMIELIDYMVEVSVPMEGLRNHHQDCDLVEVIERALEDAGQTASARSVSAQLQVHGDPYLTYGNPTYLYRGVLKLLYKAIENAVEGEVVYIDLIYTENDTLIRVHNESRDKSEIDLPYYAKHSYLEEQSRTEPAELGLEFELIRAAVEAHRGALTAYRADDQRLEFIVMLPRKATEWA